LSTTCAGQEWSTPLAWRHAMEFCSRSLLVPRG
jgi:hypothetical protein